MPLVKYLRQVKYLSMSLFRASFRSQRGNASPNTAEICTTVLLSYCFIILRKIHFENV